MRRVRTVAILSLVGLVGCGSEYEDQIKLVRVTGTITKNGKPLADAKVSFVPQTGNKESTPGVDQTGPDGNYMLKFKGRTGVAPGKYKVTVTPPVELPATAKVPDAFKNDPMMIQFAQEAKAMVKKGGGAEVKHEALKNEFDAEIPDTAASVTQDFDVKSSSSAESPKKS